MNNKYLNIFCDSLSYKFGYMGFSFDNLNFIMKDNQEKFKNEIIENLMNLPIDKTIFYLDFVENQIKKTPYFNQDTSLLNKWIIKYNLENLEFPFKENKVVSEILYISLNSFKFESDEMKILVESIQKDFYCYAAMIYANHSIEFLNQQKSYSSKNTDTNGTTGPRSLTVNQAIILLSKVSFFDTFYINKLSNVKIAKLISIILDKNQKNIKTAIEKLDTNPGDVSEKYQSDIDYINKLLDNL